MASKDPLVDRVKGYPKLAGHMQLRPEVAMFRRFGALNALNLLYFQAELAYLEGELQEKQEEDKQSGHERKSRYAWSWYELSTSKENGDEDQLRLIHRVRDTLRLYNEALIQQSTILAYPEPDQYDLNFIQSVLQDMGGPFRGPDATIWGSLSSRKSHSLDLITLHPRQKEDPFSGWVVEKAITSLSCCLRLKKPSKTHGMIGYHDTTVLKITYWITSILASLVPIISILVLYCVHSMPARLGIIGAFNISFSMCLVVFTNARRAEVFAITAAWVCGNSGGIYQRRQKVTD